MWSSLWVSVFVVFRFLIAAVESAELVPGTSLRILPLGDSITLGNGSSDGNGYRYHLYNHLQGSNMQFIGDVANGNALHNRCSAYYGFTIAWIHDTAKPTFDKRPNVVLLHAGTNDFTRERPGQSFVEAPDRLGALIDDILSLSPNATILVALIVPTTMDYMIQPINTYNAAVPQVVAERRSKGFKVMLVDMRSVNSFHDKLHPDDTGYKQMADIWYQGLQTAASYGWISNPDPELIPAFNDRMQPCPIGTSNFVPPVF